MAALTPSALPDVINPPPPHQEPLGNTERKTCDVAVQVILQTCQERELLNRLEVKVSRECRELLDENDVPKDIFKDSRYETPDELEDLSGDEDKAIARAERDAGPGDERAAQNDALLDIGLKKRDLQKVYLAAHHGSPQHIENTRNFLRDALAVLDKVDIEYLKDQKNNDECVGYDIIG